MYPRYKRQAQPLLGAAHGTIGVLMQIIQAAMLVPSLRSGDASLIETIKATISRLLALQADDGSFPNVQPGPKAKEAYLTHFDQGAPGAIPMLLSAVSLLRAVSPDPDGPTRDLMAQTYKAALAAATVTWEQGLLLKGGGLDQGIAGNAYLLHSVARWHSTQCDEELLSFLV